MSIAENRSLQSSSAGAASTVAWLAKRDWVVWLLPLAWSMLLHLPYLTTSGADDGFFTEVAALWRQGVLPYVGVFDVKPPGFFAVLTLMQSVAGPGFAALRVIGITSDAVTMALMISLARRHGELGAGLFAALIFAWISQTIVHEDCYSLLIAVTSAGMFIGLSDISIGKRALCAGLAIGAAGMIKQTAAFEALALLMILMNDTLAIGRRWIVVGLFVAGAGVAPLLVLGYFDAHGNLSELLIDIIGIALKRPGSNSDNISFAGGIVRFALATPGLSPLFLIAVLTSLAQIRVAWRRKPVPALCLWLALSFLGVLLQHALVSAYMGVMLPPMLLIAGFGLAIVLKRAPAIARVGLIAIAGFEAILSLGFAIWLEPTDMHGLEHVAAEIRSMHPSSDDRLYVIDTGPKSVWLYSMTHLKPATPYLIPLQSMCDFPNVGPQRIAEAFASRPRFVVTDAKPIPYECSVPDVSETVAAALTRDYRLIARVGEAQNLYEVSTPAP